MEENVIIPLAGIMLPMVLVPTIITLVHRHKKREWRHKERLRALELGLPAVDLEPKIGGGTVTAIGAGVPAASILGALLTTASIPPTHTEFLPMVAIAWGCACLISAAAVTGGLVLGIMLMRSRKSVEPADQFASTKPTYDPDAYDVVSRRGEETLRATG
jgi:hypothetical protein